MIRTLLAALAALLMLTPPSFAAQQTINVGTAANDGTGDTLRAAGVKMNDNFTELYAAKITVLKTTAAGGETSLTVSGIPGTGNRIEIEIFGRTSAAALAQDPVIRVNGLSTNIYAMQREYWSGGSGGADTGVAVDSIRQSTTANIALPGTSARANDVGHIFIDIPGYAQTTFFKPYTMNGRQTNSASNGTTYSIYGHGVIDVTAAITSVTVSPQSTNTWVAGSYVLVRVLP